MQTVMARRGYEIAQTPDGTMMVVPETRTAMRAQFLALSLIVGVPLTAFVYAMIGQVGATVVGAVFLGFPLLIWIVMWLLAPGPLTIKLTNDAMILRNKTRLLRKDIREVYARGPDDTVVSGKSAMQMNVRAAQARQVAAMRWVVAIVYGGDDYVISSNLTELLAVNITGEIARWMEASAAEHQTAGDHRVVEQIGAAPDHRKLGLVLMVSAVAAYAVADALTGGLKGISDLGEVVAGLALSPLLVVLAVIQPASNVAVASHHPPVIVLCFCGLAFWSGIVLLVRGAWRSRRRAANA